jgi:hypothetical protein
LLPIKKEKEKKEKTGIKRPERKMKRKLSHFQE